MSPVLRRSTTDRQDRARAIALVLTATLDKVPGLREALPRLRELEAALRDRGLVALSDAPLPSVAQLRAHIACLSPNDSPELQASRVRLLASIDRRRQRRRENMPTFVSNEDLYAGEATFSQFLEEFGSASAPR